MTNSFKKKVLNYHVKKYGVPKIDISKIEVERAAINRAEIERANPFEMRFRYNDTGEICTIDTRDDDAFDKMFDSGRPVTMLFGK